jgi:glyoxylase-like metal-dependent hydrolase (beta-lactamase superfamily II)
MRLLIDGHFEFAENNYFRDGKEDKRVRIPVNCFLIETEVGFVLIDAGCGNYYGAICGQLENALKASGHEISEVKHVLLTHLHPDHMGGLPLFPEATLFISKLEFEHWMDPSKEIEITERNKKYLPFVRKTISAHKGKIILIESGQIAIPKIRAIPAYGHTPGHTAFLHDNTLFCGDILSDLQLGCLERATVFDHNPTQATATRLELIKLASAHHYPLAGAHLTKLSVPGTDS